MRLALLASGSVALSLLSAPALAHEFWIEPLDYTVAPDGTVEAHLVNGQIFDGPTYAYLPNRFSRFEIFSGGLAAPVEARVGDRPALSLAAPAEGLTVVAYVSTPMNVDYETFEDFMRFVEHKGFEDVPARHAEAGHPMENFREVYTRHAKALVAVGAGDGADSHIGLETEIVALENPYTGDMSDGIDVQVFYGDAPRADAQVELFDKAPDGSVEVTLHRTDGDGIVTLPVAPGHSYLVDAVILRSPLGDLAAERGAAWESLWASLTFAVPE
ncbi:hypothetical protein OG2516_02149 [Oceanicola granulosus HTCC2516]|uniref:ABC-type Co2+ transport system, periplasmic component n=1 Tax=Oceanicola granulosus (strain ATCC BAA-861 / DSM 15982 / KCTC 12143 / HTCC2516) TaxID=314256 RepID=Q2CHU4_OCEGH|nr:DUF4198 domain-containing protein [Oceanicola granulosus]EAR52200.1 hypothetical protein OG2516_02149 [Oceanicola granulosus HTCC2516]